ncbi:hypothetical protein HXW94_18820 [Desulfobacter latus]|uniref:CopG family transcriptional regulator n=2 Tax=Desulfobacter latus TaxID=2292 RepID=A0A850T0D6_9BACT|nr:hypothetical protein [Desulfobacter latus]
MVIDMRDEYDFSKAERGKFYRQNSKLNIPIYLVDQDVLDFVKKIASKKGIDRSTVVNDLIKGNIKIAQAIE